MSDIFNRNYFEAELRSQATPTFLYPQFSAITRQPKNTFYLSGLQPIDFDIDAFEFHHIHDWYDAVQLEKQLSDETRQFFRSPDPPQDTESSGATDDLESVCTPSLNKETPAPSKKQESGVMGSQVDFNYQEPSFEHATDPQVPPPDPINFAPIPPHTPIHERRIVKHERAQMTAERSIDSLSVNIFSPNLDLSRTSGNKKRSADSAFLSPTIAAQCAPKKTRLHSGAWMIANIDHMLGEIPTPSERDFPYEIPPNPEPEQQPNKIANLTSPIPSYTATDLDPNGKPACSVIFKAYPGQFHGVTKDDLLSSRPKTEKPAAAAVEWGAFPNANGTITHPCCPPAPPTSATTTPAIDLSGRVRRHRHSATPGPRLAFLDAEEDAAASERVACLRSEKQEKARKMLHQEASEARLRGAAVGRYRYEGA